MRNSAVLGWRLNVRVGGRTVLRAYRHALVADDAGLAEGLIAWLGGQPNVAAAAKRAAGVKGDLDPFGAMHFLAGLLTILQRLGAPGIGPRA